jgi:hypothetical protein
LAANQFRVFGQKEDASSELHRRRTLVNFAREKWVRHK